MSKDFKRKDLHKKKRLADKWRKPKGIQNKMRLQRKGHRGLVKPGYGTKTEDKNTYKGLLITKVTTIEQLKAIDPKKQAIQIIGLGARKKLELIKEAEKHKITIINLNTKKYEENFNAKKEEKKKAKDAKAKSKQKKKPEPKPEKKEEKQEELTDEEKKEKEKQEKDKLLTKRQ